MVLSKYSLTNLGLIKIMKKEIKYTLLSFPFTYLLLLIISLKMIYDPYSKYQACSGFGESI